MRIFFLLLLLANIAFFVWHDRISGWIAPGAPEQRTVVRSEAGVPSIVLLSERGKEEAAAQPPEDAAPAMTAAHCASAGPFTDHAAAVQARAAAIEARFKANIEPDERDVVVNYLLLLPERYTDAEHAEAVLQTLRAKGVEDAAAIPVGNGFAVSLGIYNRPRAMEKRRQQVIAAGFSPEVRERHARQTVYSILVGYGDRDGDHLADLKETFSLLEPQLEWQDAACR